MIARTSLLAAAVLTGSLALSTTGFANWNHKGDSAKDQSRVENGMKAQAATSVDSLKGMRVRDNAGQEIGTVKDVMFDPHTAMIDYLILTSGTAGNEKEYAVPFDSVRWNADRTLFTSNLDRSRLYGSPEYYGVSPSAPSAGDPSHAATRPDLEKLEGMRVQDRSGHDFGFVRSAGFNTKTSTIDHLIVFSQTSAGERHYSVPLSDVQYRADQNAFQLNVETDRLTTAALATGAPAEFYGVSPAQGETLSEVRQSYLNRHEYGATQANRTGQPPSRWELGSSDSGRYYREGYQMGDTYWQVK